MAEDSARERVSHGAGPGSAGPLWVLVLGIAAAAIVILAAAVALARDYHDTQHDHAEELLAQSAVDSAVELERWLGEGNADIEIVAAQSGMADRYKRWKAGSDPAFPQALARRLEADRRYGGYACVSMFDAAGNVVVASPSESCVAAVGAIDLLVVRALAWEGAVFEDHYHDRNGNWMVAWAAPMRQESGVPAVGAIVYTMAMQQPTQELIGDELLPYKTGEVALAREHDEGFDVLSTATEFGSVTLSAGSVLEKSLVVDLEDAVDVVRYGTDADGTPVIVAAHRVADTGWLVSAQVDAAEVDAPVWRYSLMVGGTALLLIATVALGGAMTWRIRNERYREYQVLLELESALEVRDRFLTSMSHELRTPLQSIMGFTSVMLGGLTGPLTDEQRHQLTMVDGSSKRLLALVDDVLDLSKMNAGRMAVSATEFAAGDIEQTVCEMMRPLIARKSILCAPLVDDPALVLRTDRDMVERIVLNLVSNAIKFTDEGFVNLMIHADGPDHVIFEVIDSGRGIPADQLERVMEEFHQVVEVGGVKPVGTGLGLAISRRMAEALGGTLSCESEVGRGSRFWLRIPRVYPGRE